MIKLSTKAKNMAILKIQVVIKKIVIIVVNMEFVQMLIEVLKEIVTIVATFPQTVQNVSETLVFNVILDLTLIINVC